MSADPSLRLTVRVFAAHLARNLADDALHQRLERDEARRAAVLVDDERLADAPAPHVGEQIVGAERDRARSALRAPARPAFTFIVRRQRLQQIGHVQHADDVVEVVAVDRQPRMVALARSGW